MTDVSLAAPLTGCEEDGLIVGADDVTIDLNGYSIEGAGHSSPGSGVAVHDRTGVTVKNGTIRGFGRGVALIGTSSSEVRNVAIADVGTGIRLVLSGSNRLVGNSVTRAGTGIRADQADALYAERNSVSGLYAGIWVEESAGTSLVRNVASGNAFHGIFLFRSGSNSVLYARNIANNNGGSGISTLDNHGIYLDNVTNGNAGNGLSLWDQDTSHGYGFTVKGHVANANAAFGIWTNMDAVVDGGKNRARANGLGQCVGITCKWR